MKKKFFAVALATTMALSTAISASAETAASFSGVVFKDNTGREELSGNFDVTYTFNMKAPNAKENYHSFVVEFMGTDGTTNGYLDLRADAFGWFAGESKPEDALWFGGGDIVFTNDYTFSGLQDATWIDIIKDANVTVNAKRSGDTITVTYKIVGANGTTVNMSVPVANSKGYGEKVSITLTAENCTLSDIKFTNNTAQGGDSTPDPTTEAPKGDNPTTKAPAPTTKAPTAAKTGDVAPVAALAAVAVVACAAVVVSKKKVTE